MPLKSFIHRDFHLKTFSQTGRKPEDYNSKPKRKGKKKEKTKPSADLLNLDGLVKQKACLTNPDRKLTNTLTIPSFSKCKAGKKIHSGNVSIKKKKKALVIEWTGKQGKY